MQIQFSKWLTKSKKSQIEVILIEYSRIVNYFITKYKDNIVNTEKFDVLTAEHIQMCIQNTGTWLTARMVKNAFAEGYGMLQSYHSNLEQNAKHKVPVHSGKKAILSETITTQFDDVNTKEFDFNVTLGCIGNKQKISIPLKKHKHFNELSKMGRRCKSIVLTKDYIQFTFDIKIDKKKTEGFDIGVDIGLNKLIASIIVRRHI